MFDRREVKDESVGRETKETGVRDQEHRGRSVKEVMDNKNHAHESSYYSQNRQDQISIWEHDQGGEDARMRDMSSPTNGRIREMREKEKYEVDGIKDHGDGAMSEGDDPKGEQETQGERERLVELELGLERLIGREGGASVEYSSGGLETGKGTVIRIDGETKAKILDDARARFTFLEEVGEKKK